jgi:hypothetical protein
MSDRIVAMRTSLRDALVANGCPTPSPIFPDWNHVVDQIGKLSHTTLHAHSKYRNHLPSSLPTRLSVIGKIESSEQISLVGRLFPCSWRENPNRGALH